MTDILWTIALPGALILGTFAWMLTRPASVRISVHDGQLTVEPLGLNKIWCVRGKILVPLTQVTHIEAADRESLPRPGIRLPGTYLPGIITAGSFGLRPHRTFWNVRRAKRLLVVRCTPEAPYRTLVLEVPDPSGLAARLQPRL